MNDYNKDRDEELDTLLEPLRTEHPGDRQIEGWLTRLRREGRQSWQARLIARTTEWAVAASIGFFVAMAMGQGGLTQDADVSKEDYSGIDATQMQLVAITE